MRTRAYGHELISTCAKAQYLYCERRRSSHGDSGRRGRQHTTPAILHMADASATAEPPLPPPPPPSTTAVDGETAAAVSQPAAPSRPLGFNFRAVQAAYNAIQSSNLGGADAALQRQIVICLTLCEAALLQVAKQDIFSPNETVEDINTGDLKYLLLPFYRGELLLKVADQSKRSLALKEALSCLRGFLADLERLELLTDASRGWQMGTSKSSDPGDVRTAKIARFKEEKAAKEKMAAITEKLAKAGGRNGDDDDDDNDELEREHLILMLQLSCHTAITSIRAADQEADMLKQIAKLRRPDGSLPPTPTIDEEDPSQGLQMLTLLPGGGMGKPRTLAPNTLQGFVATDPKLDADSRLSYATAMKQLHTGEIPGLYTFTVEEGLRMEEAERALAEAARMQQMSERAEGRAQQRRDKEEGADEEDEDERQKLIKQDEYRETHKRGAGNRKNRS